MCEWFYQVLQNLILQKTIEHPIRKDMFKGCLEIEVLEHEVNELYGVQRPPPTDPRQGQGQGRRAEPHLLQLL